MKHIAHMGEMRNAYRILFVSPKEKRPLGRTECTYKDITKDLKETGWDAENWIHLAEERVQWRVYVNALMHLRVP
jgi:hypothetical protein